MIRLKNRIISMDQSRWPRKVWDWDLTTKTDAWYSDICFILTYAELNANVEATLVTDLSHLHGILMNKNRKYLVTNPR